MIEERDNTLDAFNQRRADETIKSNKIKADRAWPEYWSEHRKKLELS